LNRGHAKTPATIRRRNYRKGRLPANIWVHTRQKETTEGKVLGCRCKTRRSMEGAGWGSWGVQGRVGEKKRIEYRCGEVGSEELPAGGGNRVKTKGNGPGFIKTNRKTKRSGGSGNCSEAWRQRGEKA